MTSLGSATRGLDELFKEAGSVHNILVYTEQRCQLAEGKYNRDVTWLGIGLMLQNCLEIIRVNIISKNL